METTREQDIRWMRQGSAQPGFQTWVSWKLMVKVNSDSRRHWVHSHSAMQGSPGLGGVGGAAAPGNTCVVLQHHLGVDTRSGPRMAGTCTGPGNA